MIRHELRQSCLRVYNDPGASYWSTPDALVNVLWLSQQSIVLSEMRGEFTRTTWRELLDWLASHRLEIIQCERSEPHTLPCSRPSALGPGWHRIDVAELLAHFRHQQQDQTEGTR